MAAAGFYVIGDNSEPDLVECFICGKQLNGWEPNDDPWYVEWSVYRFIIIIIILVNENLRNQKLAGLSMWSISQTVPMLK